MALLKDTIILPEEYNKLPDISNVKDVPKDNLQDLEDLRTLLTKHNVPSTVSVRLIHKHFDIEDREVMVFKYATVPQYGTLQCMRPVDASSESKLRGIHYYVTDTGVLQAYEYTTNRGSDLCGYDSFLGEFCDLVVQRGLQHKFGLKFKSNDDLDKMNWTEFEFPSARSTIVIPDGMPMPEGDESFSVNTEWGRENEDIPQGNQLRCRHCEHGRCNHSRSPNPKSEDPLYFGGHLVSPNTQVFGLLNAVVKVW
ncbi:hypothetical protein F4680DRAFT_465135 [Xylaria scruposa]|nr:hypothetical protein F4680DRAFT_465135 [Xylaria scruposa]